MNKTILVNREHYFKESFLKKINLIEIKDINNETIYLEKETYEHYLDLKNFLLTKNITIGIGSAFRSLEYQEEIYQSFLKKYGEKYANQVVAQSGTSEHHTGLALDIVIYYDNHFLVDNDELMTQENIYREIHKYLANFGFILRYPKGKEKITSYLYEPWHIRYVGPFVAKLIYERNLTLEEYLKEFSGIILVNKEKNMTSFNVVKEISKLFGIKKVGHTGTLDPLAEGVIIIAIGKATKIVELLTAKEKEYIATVKLGIKTDTLDITGKIIAEKEVKKDLPLKDILTSFKKTYLQEVPIYSAVKINGKKLYEYARKGKKIELPKKEVTIKEIKLLDYKDNTFTFKTLVSKGCYIRSLINDICHALNTYGTMTKLIRTKQGKVNLKDCNTLNDIKNGIFNILSIDQIMDYQIIIVDEDIKKKIKSGQSLENSWNIKDKVIFKDKNNLLLGIYQVNSNILKVWKNFI